MMEKKNEKYSFFWKFIAWNRSNLVYQYINDVSDFGDISCRHEPLRNGANINAKTIDIF